MKSKVTIKEVQKIIPIFFAVDSNYLPFLSVSLDSLIQNASNKYLYKIFILCNGILEKDRGEIYKLNNQFVDINFIDVRDKLEEVKDNLQLRDYYTGSTYYRIFIASMFPMYDKAIYLDSDTIVLEDISKLFNVDLKDNYVAAVPDKAVYMNPVFRKYCFEVLDIESSNYFNAGVLVLNLKKIRDDKFYDQFFKLLKEYKFIVAQDQDYLNVLCKGKIKYLSYSWNTMPVGGELKRRPNIVHYNLTLKPWHYNDIPYAKYFWKYAEGNSYYNIIEEILNNYSDEQKEHDKEVENNLISLAKKEIENENNYLRTINKTKRITLDTFLEKLLFEDEDIDLMDESFVRLGVK